MSYSTELAAEYAKAPFLDLPWNANTAGADYEAAVSDRIDSIAYSLVPVDFEKDGRSIRFWTTSDALKLGGVRINATARFEQELADALGLTLLTTELADQAWNKADKQIPPSPKSATQEQLQVMGTVGAMAAHSARVDALADGVDGLIADPGKNWVLASGNVATYGWHKPGGGMIQGAYFKHGLDHSDYSQTVRLVGDTVEIDGVEMSTRDAYLEHPELFGSPGVASVPLC